MRTTFTVVANPTGMYRFHCHIMPEDRDVTYGPYLNREEAITAVTRHMELCDTCNIFGTDGTPELEEIYDVADTVTVDTVIAALTLDLIGIPAESRRPDGSGVMHAEEFLGRCLLALAIAPAKAATCSNPIHDDVYETFTDLMNANQIDHALTKIADIATKGNTLNRCVQWSNAA